MNKEFYSATWNTDFLELPRKWILRTYEQIPTRPTAQIELSYDYLMDAVKCVVTEGKMEGRINTVARFSSNLEFSWPKYNDKTKKCDEAWSDWNVSGRYQNAVEALCHRILLASDVGCPAQARVDFPEAIKSEFWTQLMQDMENFYSVASVMLT